ncbi:hypothetical protein [Modestobacter altitudinis]|uniref:hypothetical protein n=1 Tax=Modestobacter altitudinis TaxID=2213158 RepID=UPI001FE724BA|nr:hypothetical protein [Modestobacter altitudinis]
MRAVQISRFGGPEVTDVVDLADPVPGEGEQLFDISSSGVNFADTHHFLFREVHRPGSWPRTRRRRTWMGDLLVRRAGHR